MGSLRSFLSAPKNQKTLSWIGGGLVAVIAGLWAVFVYVFPPKDDHGGGSIKVEASCGGAAVQGTMIGSSITTGGASSTANCPPNPK
jgi:hypothetical protein